MSTEGLIFALILTVGCVVMVVLPLFTRRQSTASVDDQLRDKQRERLHMYYDRTLRNIRDLDEDHALGKINEDEYQAERELWMQRGVQVLKALDALDPATASSAAPAMIPATAVDDAEVDRAIDAGIEAAVRAYRAQQAAEQPPTDQPTVDQATAEQPSR
ncbi:MAG: hypothetical protein GYB67_06445 [Chloroflexi bacterium]|nr:hypothetical protein [Chloroflexota bacterium]